jgi:hypothetical protein
METDYSGMEILLSNASLESVWGRMPKAAMERFDLNKMVRSWSDQFCNLFKSSKKFIDGVHRETYRGSALY